MDNDIIEQRENSTLDSCFSNNVALLERLIKHVDPHVVKKLLNICKDIPQLFNVLLQRESSPELSLRDDDSVLTNFIRICIKYIFPLFEYSDGISLKYALKTDVPEAIAMMCYHLDRVLYRNPKSHIISVTSILVLRGMCPKIIGVSVPVAKKLMKVAGLSSLADKDLSDDISIIIRCSSGDVHICGKCKKWICDDCGDDKGKVPRLNLTECNKEPLRTRETFSPRSIIHPRRRSASKDSPRSSTNLQSFLKPDSPGNPFNKKLSMYDNFCRDVIYKGYRSVLLPSTPRKYDYYFSTEEIGELMKAWHSFTNTFENYQSYGDMIRIVARNNNYEFSKKDLIFWDDLFSIEHKNRLYDEVTQKIENPNDTITEIKWKRMFKKLGKTGSSIIFRS